MATWKTSGPGKVILRTHEAGSVRLNGRLVGKVGRIWKVDFDGSFGFFLGIIGNDI